MNILFDQNLYDKFQLSMHKIFSGFYKTYKCVFTVIEIVCKPRAFVVVALTSNSLKRIRVVIKILFHVNISL
jgi:hypothetical protein